jgi:hypothetical protein
LSWRDLKVSDRNSSGNKESVENEAVRTTIVGGRPPGHGWGRGEIPHGIEVLIKKAAVDPSFHQLLLEKRAEAAREIMGLELTPAEIHILDSAPAAQLEAVIENTKVPDAQRRAFLGRAAKIMLAVIATGCACRACNEVVDEVNQVFDNITESLGARPDDPSVD